jgi:hypothetical protein
VQYARLRARNKKASLAGLAFLHLYSSTRIVHPGAIGQGRFL